MDTPANSGIMANSMCIVIPKRKSPHRIEIWMVLESEDTMMYLLE
jgi:hypothetical protein